MLVLSRKKNEAIIIGEGNKKVVVRVVEIRGNKVRLGFSADDGVTIMRSEIISTKQEPKDGLERSASGGPFYTF